VCVLIPLRESVSVYEYAGVCACEYVSTCVRMCVCVCV
jgi:hypothetical protein